MVFGGRQALLCSAIIFWATSSAADECDAIVGNLIARVPGLSMGERTPVQGSSDIFNLAHPDAQQMSVFCPEEGIPWPVLNVDRTDGLPPPEYFKLIGKAGSAMTGVSADEIAKGALKCQEMALGAKNELADLEYEGISFECQAYTRDDGATIMSLAKHTDKK